MKFYFLFFYKILIIFFFNAPLYIAVSNGSIEIVKLLLSDNKIDVNAFSVYHCFLWNFSQIIQFNFHTKNLRTFEPNDLIKFIIQKFYMIFN